MSNGRERTVDNIADYIGDIGWTYERFALEEIVDTSLERKAKILDVMRNHPNFDEESNGIVFTADYVRQPDSYTCYEFRRWAENRIYQTYDEDDSRFTYSDILWCLTTSDTQFLSANEADDIDRAISSHNLEKLQKFKPHAGQKRSRLVGKFLRTLGIDKFDDFEQRFAQYADAINPLKIARHTVISVNARDFIGMSDGVSWGSCHNPNKEDYSGCNCSGGISHALDKVSIIMYTVSADYTGDLQCAKKVDRCIFYTDENMTHFIQSKVYPSGTQEKCDEFREIFQQVFSDCLGVPNLWKKKNPDNYWDVIGGNSDSTVYPDWESVSRNHITMFYQSSADESTFEKIWVGAAPICVTCGYEHEYKGEISCCYPWDNKRCENCGDSINEDEECYSEFHRAYGCEHCMTYNSWCDDWFWDSDDTEPVRIGRYTEYIPVCYMEDSDKFVQCYDCGEWIYLPDGEYYVDHYGDYYCDSCGSCSLEQCDDCGEFYDMDDIVEIGGRHYCEHCADCHKDEADTETVAMCG